MSPSVGTPAAAAAAAAAVTTAADESPSPPFLGVEVPLPLELTCVGIGLELNDMRFRPMPPPVGVANGVRFGVALPPSSSDDSLCWPRFRSKYASKAEKSLKQALRKRRCDAKRESSCEQRSQNLQQKQHQQHRMRARKLVGSASQEHISGTQKKQ